MWVWTYSWVNKPEEATALLEFASANKVDTFIPQAAEHKIQVELLFGGNQWVENPDVAVALAQQASGFINKMAAPKAVAIHFDVEPHALPNWDNDKQRLSSLYLDLLDRLHLAVGRTPLQVDIGHFYGGVNVSRSGTTKSLLRWVLERVDGAVLMAYNSDPNNVLAFIKDEFGQSQGGGPQLRVGLACDCDLTPLENYCSRPTLESALAMVRQAYGTNPSFAGLAVHSYGSYRSLK
jgi:hypothetical protein